MEAETQRTALESALAEAKAAAENPALLRLRELEVLHGMAASGARFTVGLQTQLLSD